MTIIEWHHENMTPSPPVLMQEAPESSGIDLEAVRLYRQSRVRQQMKKLGIQALILSDPVNIRYATGTRNMQVFSARNAPSRYLLLTENKSILYEFTGCSHLAQGFETIDEVRNAETASFVAAGPDIARREKLWARTMTAEVVELTGPGPVIGMERMNAGTSVAMSRLGIRIMDAQYPVELARSIKSREEVKCMVASLRAVEHAIGRLRDCLRPGITENELWSVLHQSIIAMNGDYVETRLLSSGERTNPWFQEAACRVIRENELVALDTDVVGCHGYYSDISRTFHSGPADPTEAQKELYRTAYEQIQHNISIIRPGMSFRDYADQAWKIPEKYFANRYYLSAHGVGMTGEYPYLYHRADFPDAGYDGEIKPGMTLCVESYIGEEDGLEGVKLEEQLLVTDTGTRLLSHYPFEEELLG